MLDKPGDLAGILTSLEENDVLFIDGDSPPQPRSRGVSLLGHGEFRIDIMIDKGAGCALGGLVLSPFTLIGPPRETGLLTSPLRAPIRHKLSP